MGFFACPRQSLSLLQGKLLTCPPMGVIEFAVEPRTLPPLRSLVVEAPGLEPQQAVMWAEEALAVQGTTVDRLMWLRAKLLGSGSGSATVAFEGIERGDVTARLVSGSSPSGTLVTGLEASVEEAPGKWGVGVRPPAAVASDAVRRKAAQVADKVVSAGEGRVAVHSWMPEERMRGKRGSGNSPSGAGIATALTRYYAKYQTAAGEAVGIPVSMRRRADGAPAMQGAGWQGASTDLRKTGV